MSLRTKHFQGSTEKIQALNQRISLKAWNLKYECKLVTLFFSYKACVFSSVHWKDLEAVTACHQLAPLPPDCGLQFRFSETVACVPGAGYVHGEPGMVRRTGNAEKQVLRDVEWRRAEIRGAPAGQRGDSSSIKKNNDCSGL